MRKHNTMVAMAGYKEITELSLYRGVASEFLGTLFLVFIGCGASTTYLGFAIPYYVTAYGFGIALATMIHVTGHVSGAHVNPAVSIGFLVARYISVTRFFAYTMAQILGSLAGIGLLYGMVPEGNKIGLGVVAKNSDVTDAQAFGMEVVLVFGLLFTIIACVDERRDDLQGSSALAIGLWLSALIIVGAPWSGAGINPARVIGPLIVAGEDWSYHWVYWLGPLLGGALGSLTYSYVFRQQKQQLVTESRANMLDNNRY